MPDPAVTASGERFARDMRRIREEHDVSMDDIHDQTMISVHIIESFEQDGLFEHPTFNQVYLRSFIRSYATAAGVDPEDALDHLGRALDGEYANELAVQYLGAEPVEASATATESGIASSDTAEAPSQPITKEEKDDRTSTAGEEGDDAGSDAEDPSGSEPSEDELIPDENRRGILIGIGAVLVIIIAWVLIDVFQGGNVADPSGTSEPAADTADANQLMAISFDSLARLTAPRVNIGDTMFFTIIAQQRLDPIRIQRDDDLRRPYYFNRGQAGVFPAQQEITISEDLQDIRLLINGHEFPNLQAVTPPLILNRDSVQTFLDSTTSEPLQLVVPVDTFPVVGG
jgi:hypothetical protein